ncbi:MAG: hypothetical protein PHP28_06780 [Actinomycetota bacterium]|nr:hypothetical protein [Actinomycetota bacterium]MDD5666801.1 hypothetical protein [Actinomycetota bacterium]
MSDLEGYREKKKRWQKFMYSYNAAMCFSAGPPMVLAPDFARKLLKWPHDDPVMMGIYGSIVTSVGVLSAAALRDESKYAEFLPVLLTQIMYKTATCLLIANRWRKKEASSWGMHFLFWFFVLYIVFLAQAIPWKAGTCCGEDDGCCRG